MRAHKFWTHTTWIVTTAALLRIPFIAVAQESSSFGGADLLSIRRVGLRINRGNIVTAFTGHLKQFLGDCAGEEWVGTATEDNVHFISYNISPRQDLRVELTNLTSGKRLVKRYTQKGYGSLDFKVFTLSAGNGRQDIQYKIYNAVTNTALETGVFSYDLTTSTRTYRRDGEWRSELFCATTNEDDLKDCPSIAGRQRLYCEGQRTETTRNPKTSHRPIPFS